MTAEQEKQWAEYIGPIARDDMRKSGVLASVTAAQAILESGYGSTDLAVNAHNLFGMKCSLSGNTWPGSTWDGRSVYTKRTPEDDGTGRIYYITADFRKYPSVTESVADHSAYLLGAMNGSKKRYAGLKGETDPQKAIQIIKDGGYATDTKYVSKILDIIKRFNLTYYDRKEEAHMGKPTIINRVPQNAGQVPAHKSTVPAFIVIHYLGVANADNPDLYGGGYGGHFYISRAGDIYQAADPAKDVVWQCGGGRQGYDPGSGKFFNVCTNYNSVGIENGVNYDGTWYFTKETQESLVKLVSYLMDLYGIPEDHVIRHWDVTGKHCPAPYVENTGYRTNWTWDQFKKKLSDYRSGKGDEDQMISEVMKTVRVKDGSTKYKHRYVKVKAGSYLNVRLAPNADAPKHPYWGRLARGNEVNEILKMDNGWSLIMIWAGEGTGTVGYVKTSYLSSKKVV